MKINMSELDDSVHNALRMRMAHEYGEVSSTNFLLETLLEGVIVQRDALQAKVVELEATNTELLRALAEKKDRKPKVE